VLQQCFEVLDLARLDQQLGEALAVAGAPANFDRAAYLIRAAQAPAQLQKLARSERELSGLHEIRL
jgi:hypothetical protein